MIVPNKVIRFSDSIIGKMPIILEYISTKEMTIKELYFSTQNHFEEIDEFIYSIDVLYLLDAIRVDFDKGVVKYVSKD
ncbi:ABC-three component system middle component 7 [Guptibacillus spartinae]|uniref:ABC-three component system middle component 7 n=1 Tax=Guptibacillus spartinae TaxID=3025679 RepID=UPI00236284E2|nr:ABC-three component system middle component 7 [Pseudalkalibacillus spartinae]